MPKDKKRDKEDELYLAGLKGRVRVQEILRRLGLSSVEADLATEAGDDMISQAVLDLRVDLEKGLKAIRESNEETREAMEKSNKEAREAMEKSNKEAREAMEGKYNWLIGIGGFIALLLAIITLAQTGVLPR